MIQDRRKKRKNRIGFGGAGCLIVLLIFAVLVSGVGIILFLPVMAENEVGPASDRLNYLQKVQYSMMMVWYKALLVEPADSAAKEVNFEIASGEGVGTIAINLESLRLIRSADAFTAYLVYAGLDTGLQAGEYQLNAGMTSMEIAKKLQDATPSRVKFNVLPGWRMEEIAEIMPTSGMSIRQEEFLSAARNPSGYDFIPAGVSAEGFLFPGEYVLPRAIRAEQLVAYLINQSALQFTSELRDGFARQNLNIFQAVTLASIIQREALVQEEQPIIASVFINRLNAGMKLETDPTVQYAVGFDSDSKSWWKVPLTGSDLAVDSAYNTYLIPGLPAGPISNPGLSAIKSVAFPAQTPYFYFRARCDGTLLHDFSETYEQHLNSGCQ